MAKSTWLKIVVSIFLAICIGYYVNQYLASLSTTVNVVVAAESIEPQTIITKEMLSTISVNQDNQKRLAPKAVYAESSIVGSVALKAFSPGQVIENTPESIVQDLGQGKAVQSQQEGSLRKSYFIPSDKRAVTVKVDAEGSLSFGLEKGDKVDIVFTTEQNRSEGGYSTVILQDIEVFETSEVTEEDRKKNLSTMTQNITFLVTPAEAQDLIFAKRNGKIDLQLVPLDAVDTKVQLDPTREYKFVN